MKILSREEFLSTDGITRELVQLPSRGGAVYVKAMTADQRDAWELEMLSAQSAGNVDPRKIKSIRAKMAALCVCDADGNSLFTEADIEALGKHSSTDLGRIYDVAFRLSSVTEEDIKELEGN